jgi:hypothetical protein
MVTAPLAIDARRQAQARDYARLRRRLFFVDLALGALILAAWLGFGWAGALKAALLAWTQRLAAGRGALARSSTCRFRCLRLPLGYYSGFVLPLHDQSTQTLGGWLKDLALGQWTAALGPAARSDLLAAARGRRRVVAVGRGGYGAGDRPVVPGANADHAAVQQICAAGAGARRVGYGCSKLGRRPAQRVKACFGST